MVIWNALEDLRRRENAQARLRRGEDAADLRRRRPARPRATGRSYEENMFLRRLRRGRGRSRLKPMNCPGHMLLFGSTLRSVPRPAAPLRRGLDAAPQRARRHAARPAARAARHPGRRAHLLHGRSRSRTRSSRALDYAAYLYELFGLEARFELSTRPDNKLGTDEEWDFTEGALQAALDRRGIAVRRSTRATVPSTARRSTCT